MYTQCPECRTAFRVTAKVLQQAAGKVRCGGCEHVFSALEYLSEEMPAVEPPGPGTGDEKPGETSRRLLETLDELAGPEDVRIEDTGIEWRVLEDAIADGDAASPEDGHRQEEIRYDDNTPLPEGDEEGPEAYEPPAVPQRRESDFAAAEKAHFEEVQGDLALSEPEDWTDLLEEVNEADAIPLEVEEELAEIHNELSAKEAATSQASEATVENLEAQFETQAEALGLDIDRLHDADPEDVPRLDDLAGEDDEDEVHRDAANIGDAVDDDGLDDASATAEEAPADSGDGPEESRGDDHDEATLDADTRPALEPTGEFERQIDEAARALSGEDGNDDERDVKGEDEDNVADLYNADEPRRDDDAETVDDEDDADEFALAAESVGGDIDDSGFSFTIIDDDEDSLDDDDDDDEQQDDDEDEDDDEAADGKLTAAEHEAIAATLGIDDPSSLFDENSGNVETIIMEGDFVRSAIEAEQIAVESAARSELDNPERLADTYALSRNKVRGGRRRGDPPGYGVIAGVAILAIVLGAQFVHNMRESLATYGFFDRAIAPVYEALGQPVTPEWNIKGWQFESTSGSIDDADAALRIVSRISNGSDTPLPYPLVHVSLTDRFEEIMGSRVLEPREYLAGNVNTGRLVLPGESFTAVVGIADPAPEATGFKLNVCYRVASGTVRCAIEDFKN